MNDVWMISCTPNGKNEETSILRIYKYDADE